MGWMENSKWLFKMEMEDPSTRKKERGWMERRCPGRAGPACLPPSHPISAQQKHNRPQAHHHTQRTNTPTTPDSSSTLASLPRPPPPDDRPTGDGSGGGGGDGRVRRPGAARRERGVGDDAAVGPGPAGVVPPQRVRAAGLAGLPHRRLRPPPDAPPAAVLLPRGFRGHGRRGVGQRRRARQVHRARGRRGAAAGARGARRGPRRRVRARVRRRGAARRARRGHRPARPRPAAAQEPPGERPCRGRVGEGGGAGVGRRVRARPGAAALAGPGAGAGVGRGVQRGGRGRPAGHAHPPRRAAHHRAARRRAPQRRGCGVLLGGGHGGVRDRVHRAGAVAPRLPHQPRRHLRPRQEDAAAIAAQPE